MEGQTAHRYILWSFRTGTGYATRGLRESWLGECQHVLGMVARVVLPVRFFFQDFLKLALSWGL